MDTFNQIVGWGGNVLFVYAAFAMTKKHISCFWANGWANVLYVVQSYFMSNWSLFWISVILIGINIKGIIDWSKK
jgi:hypothetical protein